MKQLGKMSHYICDKNVVDAILKQSQFKKHPPIVLLTSKTLYCHQYSADFTYFVPLAVVFTLLVEIL